MSQVDYMIQDFKNQVGRLSEERAIFFALSTERQQQIEALTAENEQLKAQVEQLKSQDKKEEE